jgi:hypothetical protein
MRRRISRRELLQRAGTAASLLAVPGTAPSARPAKAAPPARVSEGQIIPLTNTSDVLPYPRGRGFMKFSYDFPEPSVEFEGFQFGFRLYTYENAYALDASQMTVQPKGDGLELRCTQLLWAAGQQKAPGRLTARLRRNGSFVECEADAELPHRAKSISLILRGVPRGRISGSSGNFIDPSDNEILLGYPFAAGGLFGPNAAQSITTPLAVVQSGEREFVFLSSLDDRVRAKRFFFQPGEKGYRVELVFEKEGWIRENTLRMPPWRVGRAATMEAASRPHYEHLERAYDLPDWESRADMPAWTRDVALVVALHGMAWTGYIFNDFARMLEILRWVAKQIPPSRVIAFIPAWDGRYYWNYPVYEPDPSLGGEEGFRTLLREGKKLGFRMMPMFGANAAHRAQPVFSRIADAATSRIDGDPFELNYVDWDNDRHQDGGLAYMNLGVESWRNWLAERIAAVLERYEADSYFLDIVGGWMNNPAADMHEGTRRLVEDLRARFPRVLACGEMHYDALLSFIPLHHVFSQHAYPPGMLKYARAFQHLSHPAPGRGSTGVHEFGFRRFDPETLSLSEHQIPTLTVVDDTFEKYRSLMSEVIARAKARAGIS